MAHEESVLKVNESNKVNVPDTPHIIDEKVQGFLEIYDYLSNVLSVSDLISIILEFLDSEE